VDREGALIRQQVKSIVSATLDRVYDGVDLVLGRPEHVPPRSINPNKGFFLSRRAYVDDFVATGDDLLRMLVDFADLGPGDRVLDVGSGIGRVARPMATYLQGGTYCGMDVVAEAVEWCGAAYAQSGFRFVHLDLAYGRSRAAGDAPESVRYPLEDAGFDVVFSVSLMTHLTPVAIGQNLAEQRRVLAPGGRCLNTFFVLDDWSKAALDKGTATHTFAAEHPGYRAFSESFPENRIAVDEDVVQRLHADAGLRIVEPVRFGSWSGRTSNPHLYQDAVIAVAVGT
jgi:SAM-dependent methyltransferase